MLPDWGSLLHAALRCLLCREACCLFPALQTCCLFPARPCLSLPSDMLPFPAFRHAAFPCLSACCLGLPSIPSSMLTSPLQEAQLGIKRTSSIPVRFKQMVSDCLSPTTNLHPSKHHKLSEVDVDTPPARLMSDPPLDPGEEEEVQSSHQQPGVTDAQSPPKRLRVAPQVRHNASHACCLHMTGISIWQKDSCLS